MSKLLYKPFGLVSGAIGGMLAAALFKQAWKRVSGEEDAPSATARDYSWKQVLLAGALQGAIFGVVKAGVDRAGAAAYRRATGEWPDD